MKKLFVFLSSMFALAVLNSAHAASMLGTIDLTDTVDTIQDVIQYISIIGAAYITVLAAVRAWKLLRAAFA